MSNDKNLWTFIIDFKGGTYVSQFETLSLESAIEEYNKSDPSGTDAVPLDDGVIPIDGMKNVWGGGGLNNNEISIFATIVNTTME